MLVPFLFVVLIFILMWVFASLQKNPDTNISKSFWEKFQTMFIEDASDGFWSSNRVAFIFTMFLSNLVMWGSILYLVIANSAFPIIPQGVIFIYGIANGVASVAKVWQKREERFMVELENGKETGDEK